MEALPYLKEISLKRDEIVSFESYPFCIPAVKELDLLAFHKNVTFIVGENGSGKSTFLEAIAVGMGFNAEGGTKNFSFSTKSTHSDLYNFLRYSKSYKKPSDGFFLRAESFYNVSTNIDELDDQPISLNLPKIKDSYGGKSLHNQSHGESFLSLMIHRFGGNGLYILDEPEAALSPTRQLAVLSRIHQLVKDNSQFIIATHSPILMAYPESVIYEVGNFGFNEVAYTDTEHYEITKRFLNNPDPILNELFDE